MSTFDTKTYIPNLVDFTIAGYRLEGWTELAVARNVPQYNLLRGSRGQNIRVKQLDKSLTFTLTLDMMSTSNTVLNQLLKLSELGALPQFRARLEIWEDGTLIQSDNCFIVKSPDVSFNGEETTSRVWTIHAISYEEYRVNSKAPTTTTESRERMSKFLDLADAMGFKSDVQD